jgi:hypothetical protein
MKNSLKYIAPVAVLLLAFSSCTSVKKLVCMPWQVTEVKFNDKGGVLTPEQQRLMEYQLKNEFTYRFRPDSVYMVIQRYDTMYGTWRLSADKKQIISRLNNGDEQVSDILKIDKKEFLMHPQADLGNLEYIKSIPATDKK